ncbi:MAG: hypothetical protein AAB932_05250, partial [Patescibacteria group bacterium]
IFQDGDSWYAVALEFNIVVQGDDKMEVMASLFHAVNGYVASAKKAKLRPVVLNQTPDSEYEYLWSQLHQTGKHKPKRLQGEKIIEPNQVFTYGVAPALALAA